MGFSSALKQDGGYVRLESYVKSKIDELLNEEPLKRVTLLAILSSIKVIDRLDYFDRAVLFRVADPSARGESCSSTELRARSFRW